MASQAEVPPPPHFSESSEAHPEAAAVTAEAAEVPPTVPPTRATADYVTDRPVRFFVPTDNRYGIIPQSAEDAVDSTLLSEHYTGIREALLQQFPSDETGIDTARATAFIQSLGLRVVPTIYIPEARVEEFADALQETIGGAEKIRPQEGGKYEPTIDRSFIFRNRANEEANGPEATEAAGVHENAHGSSGYDTLSVRVTEDDGDVLLVPHTPRIGFAANLDKGTYGIVRGTFLEEGWADHIRGRYIAEVLGKPNGLADYPSEEYISVYNDGSRVPLPSRYLERAQGDAGGSELYIRDAAWGAAAIDLLVQRDPALEQALIEARTSVAGLREVVGRMNTIHPRLYVAMRDAPAMKQGREGYMQIRRMLGYE